MNQKLQRITDCPKGAADRVYHDQAQREHNTTSRTKAHRGDLKNLHTTMTEPRTSVGSRATETAAKSKCGAARPVRVALLDGDSAYHATFRSHLAAGKPDWQLDVHTHGSTAWPALRAAPPQLVLIERTLPDGCGLEWLRRCQSQMPGLAVVMLTTQGCAKTLLAALLAGAQGYWVKSGDAVGLVERLRSVLAGKLSLCDQAERLLPQAFALLRQRAVDQLGLSQREEEIILCLREHKSDKEIGTALSIEAGTVHAHLMRIYAKLHVHDRASAIHKYLAAIHGRVTGG